MEKFVVAVECALEYKGSFLMITRPLQSVQAAGLLAFVGGKVEYGDKSRDTLVEAAKREVQEEVGLTLLDPIHYVTSSTFVDPRGHYVANNIFYCHLEETKVEVIPSAREVPEYYWLKIEEILSHPLCPPWIKEYLVSIENVSQIVKQPLRNLFLHG